MRLQRTLQIVESAERGGALADIERDILLEELRKAYAELKFGNVECEADEAAPVAPFIPVEEESEEESEEKEVEVEFLFAEEDEAENASEQEEQEEEQEEQVQEEEESEPVAEPEPIVVPEPAPAPEPEPIVVPEPTPAPEPIPAPIAEELDVLTEKSKNHRSAILSLYGDDPAPVIGESFLETPSVADVISCPKGVAEAAPIESLGGAIGLADKFMLVRELFDGDNDAYNAAIEALDAQPSFDDCLIYIAEHYTWSSSSEGAKYMMELLQRKYN